MVKGKQLSSLIYESGGFLYVKVRVVSPKDVLISDMFFYPGVL